MTFSPGETVGDYRIVDVIGSGGMGTVYKVQHVISDRIEALKVVLPSLVSSPDLMERFLREIKLQARLSHPNIASLHNAMRLGSSVLMIMEYIEGTTLHAQVRGSAMDPSRSIDIGLQILNALAYAHAKGVVHRDIKPANIMITDSGTVKLMDFGIARAADQLDHLTRTGAAVGSIFYMSPEQVQGAPVDQRSDLYSLGVMLYEMVTGRRPISGDTSWAIMNGHLTQAVLAPASLNANVSASLSLAILKALEKRAEDRYQSAEEFAGILQIVKSRASSEEPQPDTMLNRPSAAEQGVQVQTPPRPQSSPEQQYSTPAPQTIAPVGVKTPTPTPASGSVPATSRFDAAQLEKIKKELAAYLGPMAKILVDRTARKSTSLQQLYELLSMKIPEGPHRKKFLASRPR
ncbi:MAG TPA: protein kinase [Bryobacteraceae bacterium]|nr:protein kinase [Bryobacteraceae bacterium]